MTVDAPGSAASLGSAELAYRQIRRAIVEGRYRPGQRLIEQRISEEFQLSRTPVRESLRRLEAEGLVFSERNRGAIVRPVSEADIVDLYELRARLESLAAERAAERATPADIAELDDAITAFDQAMVAVGLSEIEVIRLIDLANSRFHDTVLRIADHYRLSRLLASAVDLPLVFQALRVFTPAERVRSNLFHQLVRDAIASSASERAGRLMSEHIFLARDTLLAHRTKDGQPLETVLFSAGDDAEAAVS